MNLSAKTAVIILMLSSAAAFAAGRYSKPQKSVIKTETKVQVKEVVKWKTRLVKDVKKDKETIIIETKFPDGTIKKETHILDRGTVLIDKTKDKEDGKIITESEKKEEHKIAELSNWKLSGMVLADPNFNIKSTGKVYGLAIERRIVGPFYIGGLAVTNGSFGAVLGVTF